MDPTEQWSPKLPEEIGWTPVKDCCWWCVPYLQSPSAEENRRRHQEENHETWQSVSSGIFSPGEFIFQKERGGPGRTGLVVALQRCRVINKKTHGEGTLVTILAAFHPNPLLC